ncbi:magnesium transporter [Magnetospirillum sp. ME-1]|uniref:zinc transporter ZntB n=1 Tax=Magnetospirillum sp. ME-1 TaxID=1639348 RepID=UPI000A17CE02|nr:zinc transporter ZntB [Magnetospirillum sp. ME-1]ARJ67406.1 magnesium transporter [Magnetospirillum sp. ME-1]
MAMDQELHAGLEPGLRFAMLIGPDGGVRDLRWSEVETWRPTDGFLWVHLERDEPRATHWLCERSGIDPLVAMALTAEESRPRVEDVGDALMVVLRGVNKARAGEGEDRSAETELVPVHIWIEADRCISLRDKDHSLNALRDLRLAMMMGKGPRTAGALLARIAEKVVDHLGILTDEIEDGISDLEDRIGEGLAGTDLREDIASARRKVVQLRRYLAPQRDALYRLRHDDASWLDPEAKMRLREVNDRLIRHIEDLDEMRQRATILHEDFTNLVAERAAQSSNRLTALAAMVLPPSLLAGMMGTNIGGIPGSQEPLAFLILCGVVLGMMPVTYLILKWIKWL